MGCIFFAFRVAIFMGDEKYFAIRHYYLKKKKNVPTSRHGQQPVSTEEDAKKKNKRRNKIRHHLTSLSVRRPLLLRREQKQQNRVHFSLLKGQPPPRPVCRTSSTDKVEHTAQGKAANCTLAHRPGGTSNAFFVWQKESRPTGDFPNHPRGENMANNDIINAPGVDVAMTTASESERRWGYVFTFSHPTADSLAGWEGAPKKPSDFTREEFFDHIDICYKEASPGPGSAKVPNFTRKR